MDSSIYSKKNVKSSAKYFVIGRLLSGMSGFLVIILFAKYMSIEDYATFIALSSLIMLLAVFSSLGLEKAAARYLPKSIHDQNMGSLIRIITSLALVRLLVGLFLSIIIYILWEYWKIFFEYMDLQALPRAFFIFFISESLFQYFSKIFQALMLQKILTKVLIIQWLGRLLFVFFLLYQFGDITLEDAFWVMAVPELIGLVFFILILFKKFKKQNALNLEKKIQASIDWHGIYHVAKNNYGFSLLVIPAQGYFMRLLVSVFFSAEVSAAYGFFSLMVERVVQYIPVKFFNSIIEPVLVSNYIKNQNFDYLRSVSQVFYKLSLIFLAALGLFVSATGELLVDTFVKTEYSEYYWFIYIILFQGVFGSHMNSLQIILNSINKSIFLIYSSGISAIAFIALYYISILMGSYFLLFVPIIFSLINNYVTISLLNRNGFNYYMNMKFLYSLFSSMFLILLLIQFLVGSVFFEGQVLYVSIIGCIAVFSFFVLLKKFNFFKKNELSMIKQYVFKT